MKSEPERIQHLWDMTHYSLKRFRDLGFEIGHTSTPIIPLYVRDMEKTFMVTKMLFDEGVFVNRWCLLHAHLTIRSFVFSLMATHTQEQIDIAIDKLATCFKKFSII